MWARYGNSPVKERIYLGVYHGAQIIDAAVFFLSLGFLNLNLSLKVTISTWFDY
jgi:hypothetical protein